MATTTGSATLSEAARGYSRLLAGQSPVSAAPQIMAMPNNQDTKHDGSNGKDIKAPPDGDSRIVFSLFGQTVTSELPRRGLTSQLTAGPLDDVIPAINSDEPIRASEQHGHGGKSYSSLRRIENPASRQVTFSKRRSGLLKKAFELSVLCDVQVAVIIFSSTGRLSEFASPSMEDVIGRYEEVNAAISRRMSKQREMEFWKRETLLLRYQIRQLQEVQGRYLLGENIGHLSFSDLHQLECKLHVAADKVKTRKMELIQAQIKEGQHEMDQITQEKNEFWKERFAKTMLSAADDQKKSGPFAIRPKPFGALDNAVKSTSSISLNLRLDPNLV